MISQIKPKIIKKAINKNEVNKFEIDKSKLINESLQYLERKYVCIITENQIISGKVKSISVVPYIISLSINTSSLVMLGIKDYNKNFIITSFLLKEGIIYYSRNKKKMKLFYEGQRL